MLHRRQLLLSVVLVAVVVGVASGQRSQPKQQRRSLPVEVYQVVGFPLNIHEASLVERDTGYVLRCRMSSEPSASIVGMRYSLTAIDAVSGPKPIVNRIEGFQLDEASGKTITFAASIKIKPQSGDRLVLMLEQVLSRETVWEVIKAKDALEAYVRGDFSIQPTVLRVANQIDAPVSTPVIYKLRKP
jgi:hypothetical protein